MNKIVSVLIATLALSTMATASDIAISTQANWWTQEAADREMQEFVDNVNAASVERFTASQQVALADWVRDHTGDGVSDLLILCGQCPATIYAPGNTQPDGSLLELFLDDGNCIINTGDWIFYVVDGAGTNGTAALPYVMDIPSMDMWDDATPVTVTADGAKYTPSLVNFNTDRAIHFDVLQNNWSAELILAVAADNNRADPVILHNSVTGGRIGIFYQKSTDDTLPRGEVMSEWINNWYLPKVGALNPLARRPSPKIGSVVDTTTVQASWFAGDLAAQHDVYFGESYDEVSAATPDTTGIYVGRQATTQLAMGVAGGPAPDGLVPGKTYYWRVDEINDGEADSPWKGNVWNFTVRPLTAWGPTPEDGATLIRLDRDLTWSAGMDAIFHNVFFGASYDEVANAVEPISQSVDPTLDFEVLGIALEAGKTYYWRVDEFAPMGITQGEVWSFSTVPVIPITDARLVGYWGFDEGVSDTAVDSSGYAHHGVLSGDIVRTEGYFGGALEFGAGRVVDCGEAALNVTGDFTLAAWVKLNPGNAGVYGGIAGKLHYATNYYGFGIVRHSGNAFRLWVGDGTTDLAKSAVSSDVTYTDTDWHHVAGVHNGLANTLYVDGVKQGATTNISFVPSSQFFHIGRQYSSQTDRTFPGLIDEVRVYDKASTDAEIATIMLGNTKLAAAPSPTNGFEVDIRNISELSWSAGTSAVSHDVYLGTDRDTVAKADHSSPEFKGNQAGTTFSVADVVAFGSGTFCWRIDEVAADGAVYTGYVWSFSVPAYLIVDNFETYTNDMDAEETIFDAWVDGLTDSLSTSVVGHEAVPFAEQAIVHGGRQAMPFYYNNANSPYFAEAVYTFDGAQDWTAEGVTTLTLAVRGKADNVASTLYVALADSSKTVAIKNADTSLLTTETWTTWTIPLSEFGVKITAIKKMYLGVGDRANPTPGGAGLIYIDDIRLVK
jgi:hypothetical protein